ncbi:MAG: ATP-binding protein [Nevskiales bacterium]
MGEPFVRFNQDDRLNWDSPLDFLVDLLRWLMILGITLVILALLLRTLSERPGHTAHELANGWIISSSAEQPPPLNAAGWQAVTLPDDWQQQKRKQLEQAWYRFELDIPDVEKALWAIYLPSLTMNAELYINGEVAGSGGEFGNRITRNWNRPLYFNLPNSLIQKGKNQIMVRLASQPPGSGLLAPIYVGPDKALKPFFQSLYTLKITIPIVASIAACLLAIATLLIYISRPVEPVYRWYGLGTLIWSVHNLYLFVANPPVPAVVWDLFWHVSLGWFIVMIPPYVHGLLGFDRPRLERGLFTYALFGTLILCGLAVYDHGLMHFVGIRIWTVSWLAIGLYPTFMMIHAVWRSRDAEVQWLLTAALLIFVLGIHDCLVSNGLLSRVDGKLMQYSIPVVIAVFGWLLLSRFVRSISEAEALNRELNERVKERTAALEESFAQMGKLERERAIQAERERILRDMHDGVGGNLVAAVAMAESGEVQSNDLAESLRGTLDELRLTIDSLDLEQGDLAAALGTLRARLQPAFMANHPKLNWAMDDLPPTPKLNPTALTHIVRIVREAVSNALRHAQANNIWVRIRFDNSQNRVRIEVEDNGHGIQNLEHAGHGLSNMRYRAEQLDASLEILSTSKGTKIVLLFSA